MKRPRAGKRNASQKIEKGRGARAFCVHPLFFLAGVYACFTTSLPLYLCAVAVALQHECAHAFAAAKLGFRLNQVVLMPYGAVIRGDISDASFKDGANIALAGPLCNFFTAIAFVATWWLFPDTYPYTEAAFYLSLYIGLGNLLPFYPLDGGRVLRAALATKLGEKRAEKICRAVTFTAAIAVAIAASVSWIYGEFSPMPYLFSLFLFFGALSRGGRYEKIRTDYRAAFLRGVEEKRIALDGQSTLKRALSFCESGKYLHIDVFKNGEKIFETDECALFSLLSGKTLYAPLISLFCAENFQKEEREAAAVQAGRTRYFGV